MRHKLIQYRQSKELSRIEVARKLNITSTYYGMIETGARNPRLVLAQQIAALIGSTVEELFGDEHQLDAKSPRHNLRLSIAKSTTPVAVYRTMCVNVTV